MNILSHDIYAISQSLLTVQLEPRTHNNGITEKLCGEIGISAAYLDEESGVLDIIFNPKSIGESCIILIIDNFNSEIISPTTLFC